MLLRKPPLLLYLVCFVLCLVTGDCWVRGLFLAELHASTKQSRRSFFVPLGHHNAQFMNGNPKERAQLKGWFARRNFGC